MKHVRFELQGKVLGKARPRFTRDGHVFTPYATRTYENAVRQAYMAAGGDLIDGVIHIDIEAVTGVQKSVSKKKQTERIMGSELSVRKPDVDNIAKIVLDALNGVAYQDDSQVVSMRIIKGRYEEKPRLIVRVREMQTTELLDSHTFLWSND